jgi:hypothetical protein
VFNHQKKLRLYIPLVTSGEEYLYLSRRIRLFSTASATRIMTLIASVLVKKAATAFVAPPNSVLERTISKGNVSKR